MQDANNKIIITPQYPTAIVEDFKTYLTYLKTHTIKLTKVNGYFTKKDLMAMHSQLKSGNRDIPAHATQTGHPMIHLFHQLSIVLDILRINRSKSAAAAFIEHQQIDDFFRLTETEQYVTLLEAFWIHADWEELQGEKWGVAPRSIDFLFEEFEKFPPDQLLNLEKYRDIYHLTSDYGQFLHHFHYFGIWTFEVDEIKSNSKRTIAKSISLTPFYKKIHHALLATWNPNKDEQLEKGFDLFMELLDIPKDIQKTMKVDENKQNKSLVELLCPLFPDGQLITILPKKKTSFKRGTYLFKVKVSSSCWRTLQLSSTHTLHDLHHLIQRAFEFDGDHLYAFYMDGKKFSKHHYNDPKDTQGPYAHEVKIGSLNLYEGQSFLYLFDFGDEWEFIIDTLKIIEGEEDEEQSILERRGEAPEQYDWFELDE